MRKGFAAPAVHFKGSGWAKKDRSATSSPGRSRTKPADEAGAASGAGSGGGEPPTSGSGDPAAATSSSSSSSSSSLFLLDKREWLTWPVPR
jgi:hypothetical protein